MNYRTRTYYTGSQRALMWERWKAGWTLHQIGHLFDRPHTSIQTILSRTGGIRPPERRRSLAALSLGEREEISRALVTGESIRSIAARLGRAPSTVSRELKRNGMHEHEGLRVFADVYGPPTRLVVVGAVDTAEALCAAAKLLGWHTICIEARAAFATPEPPSYASRTT